MLYCHKFYGKNSGFQADIVRRFCKKKPCIFVACICEICRISHKKLLLPRSVSVAFIVVASESEVMLVNFVHKIFLQPLSSRAKVTLIKNAPTGAKGVTTYTSSACTF